MTRLRLSHPVLKSEAFLIRKFLIDKFDYTSQRVSFLKNEMYFRPNFYVELVRQKYKMSNEEKIRNLMEHVGRYGFYFFCGRKGSGKTTLSYFLYQRIKEFFPKKEVYVRNMEAKAGMKEYENFDLKNAYQNLPENSVLFHDEVHYDIPPNLSSRSDEYKNLRRYFSTQRHKGTVIIQISQTTNGFHKDLLRYCDGQFYLRTSIISDLERKEFRPYIEMSQEILEGDWRFVFLNDTEIFQVEYERPDFMSGKDSFYYKED
mgnify:CR=1 FL=1